MQSEMNKILQKISSTSLVKSGEHFAFTTYSLLTTISESWSLDSGATDHMSPHKSLFKSYEPITNDHRVFTADGGILEIVGKGIIEIKGTVLRNILHVPALKASLLSLM